MAQDQCRAYLSNFFEPKVGFGAWPEGPDGDSPRPLKAWTAVIRGDARWRLVTPLAADRPPANGSGARKIELVDYFFSRRNGPGRDLVDVGPYHRQAGTACLCHRCFLQRVSLDNQIRGRAVVFGVRLPRALAAAFARQSLRASEGIAGGADAYVEIGDQPV